ncbi:hypothetical protein ACFFWC_03585 [Plantactinospora siamensis]|uniref:Uncharacterized protein n=1 Tax=Plantactinospora siamensis TaxID=555372 RepID=A0ABV6NQP3_9ACTN
MTAGEFSEADLDLLADYLGGALTGSPDESRVRELVRDDAEWAEAYTVLLAASDAVRADLAGWGAEPEPMPAAVAERLTAALAAAPPEPAPQQRPAATWPAAAETGQPTGGPNTAATGGPTAAPAQRPASGPGPARPDSPPAAPARDASTRRPGRDASTGPPSRDTSTRPPARPDPAAGPTRGGRRRWSRAARPVAVLALVAALGGVGAQWWATGFQNGSSNDSRTAAGRGDSAANSSAPVVRAPSARQPAASGTDYQPGTVAGAAERAGLAAGNLGGPGAPGGSPKDNRQPGLRPESGPVPAVPADLRRLTDPHALDGCLTAVAAEHAAGAITVQAVDLATYQGGPAVVVVFTDAAAARWAWVAGPACGLAGSGADTRYASPVG